MEIMDSGQQKITVGYRPNGLLSFPDNWQLCSLGEITISSQYGISSSSGGNYSVPILKMNNLQDGHIDLADLDYIQLSKAEMESLMLNKGDLLINRTNSPDLVGKAAVYDLAGEHVFASYLVRFRLAPSVLPAFVNYFLNSEPGQRKLKLLATKAVSQSNINPSILKSQLFVPIPPILEQHRIVEILCDWDHSINLTTQLIAKKRDIKQATMQQLLTGKTRLPEFSRELKPGYKRTEVGVIPEDWEVKELAELTTLLTNGFVGKATDFYTNSDDGVIYIQGFNVEENSYNLTGIKRVTSEFHKQHSKSKLIEGDLLTIQTGEIGLTTIVPKELEGSNCHALIISRFNKNLDSKYFSYYFNSFNGRARFKNIETGSTMKHLNVGDLHTWLVPFPPTKSEQIAIATILSDMDAEIAVLEQKRDKTRALKQGMMQELLTGKTRLI